MDHGTLYYTFDTDTSRYRKKVSGREAKSQHYIEFSGISLFQFEDASDLRP